MITKLYVYHKTSDTAYFNLVIAKRVQCETFVSSNCQTSTPRSKDIPETFELWHYLDMSIRIINYNLIGSSQIDQYVTRECYNWPQRNTLVHFHHSKSEVYRIGTISITYIHLDLALNHSYFIRRFRSNDAAWSKSTIDTFGKLHTNAVRIALRKILCFLRSVRQIVINSPNISDFLFEIELFHWIKLIWYSNRLS